MTKPKLEFEEKTHTYTYKGKELVSATEFISQFFPSFDADKEAEKRAYSYGKYKEKSKQEILDMWNKTGTDGTKIHKELEDYILGETRYEDVTVKAKHGIKYYNKYLDQKDWTLTTPELRIYSEKYGIAGTIDVHIELPTPHTGKRKATLIDWKTNKKIYQKAYKDKTGIHELTRDIPAANYYKYELQLNLYAEILRQEYNYEIDELILCHITNTNHKAIKVNNQQQKIQQLLQTRKNNDD